MPVYRANQTLSAGADGAQRERGALRGGRSASRGARGGRGGQRRNRRGGGGGSASSGYGGFGPASQRTGYTPYEPPVFSQAATLSFAGNRGSYQDEVDAAVLDAPRTFPIQKICFGAEFSIADHHLQMLAARPQIMANLQWLTLGDSDTGNGGRLTNGAVQAFLAAAPNLRVLNLDACNALTDATLTKAFEYCPWLERVKLTGHDKSHGGVRGPALKELKRRATLARNLTDLILLDQSIDDRDVERLTAARSGLAITIGNTVEDGEPVFTYYHGKIVDIQI